MPTPHLTQAHLQCPPCTPTMKKSLSHHSPLPGKFRLSLRILLNTNPHSPIRANGEEDHLPAPEPIPA